MSSNVEMLPRACPLGVCDGSGWVFHDDDSATPCDCREVRLKQARMSGVRSVLPDKYRGVGFDRPPIADMARVAQLSSELYDLLDDGDSKAVACLSRLRTVALPPALQSAVAAIEEAAGEYDYEEACDVLSKAAETAGVAIGGDTHG